MKPTSRLAATLIEVIVAMLILGIVAALALGAVQSVRSAAERSSCQNNLRQLALAGHSHNSRHGWFPRYTSFRAYEHIYQIREVFWTWTMLPDLQHGNLLEEVRADRARATLTTPPEHVGLRIVVPQYFCPADSRLRRPIKDEDGNVGTYMSYVALAGRHLRDGDRAETAGMHRSMGWWNREGTRVDMITDGLSNTLYFAESPPFGKWLRSTWYGAGHPDRELWTTRPGRSFTYMRIPAPPELICMGPFLFGPGRIQNPCDSHKPWSLHNGGGNFALADGSVKYLTYASAPLLPALVTIAGNESVAVP